MDTYVTTSISNATVNSGDVLYVQGSPGLGGYSASAYNTTVNDGGRIEASIAYLKDTHINAGGAVRLLGNHTLAENTYVAGNLTLSVLSVTASYITVADGGVLTIQAGSATGIQLLDGGQIDLVNLPYGSTVTVSFNAASDKLTVSGDAQYGRDSYDLGLNGNYDPNGFVAASDGHGGTSIFAHPLCFSAGTLIRTPEGDALIEELKVGDRVVVVSGQTRSVRWIGTSSYLVFDRNRPVVVRRGALFGLQPTMDLRVTAGHALLFGDVLIPIEELVNGSSICWDECSTFRAFHLELEQHDILIANGAAAESFRDDGNRDGFLASAGTGAAPKKTPTCAPVARSGPVVDRTRTRLAYWAAHHWRSDRHTAPQSPTVRGRELVSSSIS